MASVTASRSSDERTRDLETKRDVVRAFVSHGSPRLLLAGLALAVIARLAYGNFGWADVVVFGISLLLVGSVEWVIHRFLLHAPDDSFRMRKLGTGSGHKQHHLDPDDIGFVLLKPSDAALFLVLLLGWNATWPLVVAWTLGASLIGTYLTAVALSYVLLAHYEWTHLLVHTRYRPKSSYYRRLESHHRLHHYRNEHYWLGVTSRLGDAALRTLPATKSDVPISDTARTL